ncbi:alpha/beta hydrolase [uncultured Tenacibaculum sp.]|uniref:alpha/beta fold hydrolase n=1 Tax=uncultured Tenacibaculum sp. TaxID=174713 RepID=UPI00262082B1|nr:alpha/beta hydrolase [uncultured Tenacibaculum sp.]
MRTLYITILTVFFINTLIAQKKSINESRFITIGGIKQWVTIKGNDKEKPAILFLHGGPGSVMTPYSDSIYDKWKKDFILVNWDQRGAGRTFGENAPKEVNEDYFIENKLTLKKMVEDGIELSEYLTEYLNKKSIILMGASWGSILGIKMIQTNSSLFKGYVGNAQFVGFNKNYIYAYNKVLKLAIDSNDSIAFKKLKSLGKPPYKNTRNLGQMLRIVKKYERMNAIPAPNNWWRMNQEYNNKKDKKDRYNGDDYSFLYFAGHEKMGIRSMVKNLDFYNNSLKFNIPIYFIQGEEDILTSSKLNKIYFEKIKAPDKGYYLIKEAGHNPNELILQKQYEILRDKFL